MPDPDAPWRPPDLVRALRWVLVLTLLGYASSYVPLLRGDPRAFSAWLDAGVGDGIGVLCALLCFLRAAGSRGDRLPWSLLGAGALVYVGGDLYYYAVRAGGSEVGYPSWADVAWLSLYPLMNAGLVVLVRRQVSGVRTSLWLDGLTGGTGAAAIAGAAVLQPVLEVTNGELTAVVVNLAYPIGDLALLTVFVLVFNLHGWRPGRAWWLLGAAPSVLLVVDAIYLLQVANGTYQDGQLLDLGWSVAFSALGLAASMRPAPHRTVREGAASLVVPATLSALSTGVLFWGALGALPTVVCVLGLAAVMLASLRLVVALVETRRLVDAKREARTDELTSLPNRRLFLERVNACLQVQHPEAAVMIVDLDRFKQVNDALGHPVGDALLRIVGRRLRESVELDGTLVARLGGDEFAVLLPGADAAAARSVAQLVRRVIAEPVELSGLVLGVDASVGVALAPAHGETWEALMSRADAAMYVAKRERRGVEVYVEARDEGGIDRLALLAELRVALRAHDLVLHYQLVHRVSDRLPTSAEALVRWEHPTRGRLAPDQFLPLAIEAGLSRELTDEVLAMATTQAAAWRRQGTPLPVAVNLTEADLTDPLLVRRVGAACVDAGLPPELLRLEVTESVTAGVALSAGATLRALRAQGHELLLDDFGTGFSSLSFLRNLPLDSVKLDRSFLRDLGDPSAVALVRATVELAHQIGLTLVAEGVESEDVLDVLAAMGCDHIQGFLLHRPEPGDTVSARLTRMPAEPAAATS